VKNWKRAAIILGAIIVLLIPVIAVAAIKSGRGGPSPDRPAFAQGKEGEEEEGEDGDYLRLREQYIARLRGIEPGRFANPLWRANDSSESYEAGFSQPRSNRRRSRLSSSPRSRSWRRLPRRQRRGARSAPTALRMGRLSTAATPPSAAGRQRSPSTRPTRTRSTSERHRGASGAHSTAAPIGPQSSTTLNPFRLEHSRSRRRARALSTSARVNRA
jgi:hypothetical protein